MANLIDKDYFIRDISIPARQNSDLSTVVTEMITRYEPEYLKKVLGYTLWKSFIDGLAEETPASKWTDLRDGADLTFEYAGRTITTYWNGLKNTDKISPIAYYTYYQSRKEMETFNSGIGERKAKSENSSPQSARIKMVNAYNNCVDLTGEQNRNYKQFPDFFLNNDSYSHVSPLPSLFNFLLANIDDYSDWVFAPFWKINSFGI